MFYDIIECYYNCEITVGQDQPGRPGQRRPFRPGPGRRGFGNEFRRKC